MLKLVSLLQAYPPFPQVWSVRLRCPVLSASAVGCTRRIAGRYSVKCMSEDHVEEIASAESLRQLVEERLQSREAANAEMPPRSAAGFWAANVIVSNL